MKFEGAMKEAAIVGRLNRFAVAVLLDGRREVAHLPNSGRLAELLEPGTPALLTPRDGSGRKTAYDLTLVRCSDQWVSADARLPNRLVAEAMAAGRLAPFRGYTRVRPEARFGDSRLDFILEGNRGICLVETKSITLVVDGRALFPDAPTERGRRHLQALIEGRRRGHAAAVVFVVQRSDARRMSPWTEADPAFAAILRQAAALGVGVHAYRCRVSPSEIEISDPLLVEV